MKTSRAVAVATLMCVVSGFSRTMGLSACVGVADAQSLADVARREADRRAAVGTPGRVYTNKDLPAVAPSRPSPATTAAGGAPRDVAPAPVKGSTDRPDVSDPGGRPAAQQAAWRMRAGALRQALARAEIVAAALQSRINALTTDSANRDDPFQRAALEAEREETVRELARVQQELVDGGAALAALQDEARRAGVPPGWLRERGR